MRNRRRITTVLALLALGPLVAALNACRPAGEGVPPEPPLATSSNVHLLGHIPGSAAGMNFKDHYAYVSGWGGITVLDIAKADSPQLVGALPLPHFENEDVDLCGNTLLVVNDREAKDLGSIMYVLSIANPHRAHRQRDPAARPDRQRARLRPHRELRQDRLLAGLGRRRRPRRGRRPDRPDRAEVARQVRVGRVDERRVQGLPRHRARQHRHASGRSGAAARPATG